MNFTQDQISAIIGNQYLEIIDLRMRLGQALARINELKPHEEKDAKSDLKVVEQTP